MQPKFEIGQLVKFVNDKDSDAGKVVSYSYDSENGFVYKITSKEVDMELKEILNGFKTCKEGELMEVESE